MKIGALLPVSFPSAKHRVLAGCSIILRIALIGTGLSQGAEAQTGQAVQSSVSESVAKNWLPPLGIVAKRPVFAGACKACPWGQIAEVVKIAIADYGYDLHICYTCATSIGPRDMADRTALQQQPVAADSSFRAYIDDTPPAVPDISATSESNLIAAWNGRGVYAKDGKERHNYRVVASIQTPNYLTVAVNKASHITDLSQLKTRKHTWVFAEENDPVLAYYGVTKTSLEANGGGIIPSEGSSRELRAGADVWIGGALLADTFEQRMWYEISQMNDLAYLTLPEDLLMQLSKQPGYKRGIMPLALLRGVDRSIPTVVRENHFIYVRDDAPDDFVYMVAKALDEHRDLLTMQIEPWYYDTRHVAISNVIPLHPGAIRYYRERGYLK